MGGKPKPIFSETFAINHLNRPTEGIHCFNAKYILINI